MYFNVAKSSTKNTQKQIFSCWKLVSKFLHSVLCSGMNTSVTINALSSAPLVHPHVLREAPSQPAPRKIKQIKKLHLLKRT